MNIIEACKSGKKFRRPCWDKGDWVCVNGKELEGGYGDTRLTDKETGEQYPSLDVDDILATDYELYEEIRPKEAGEVWELNGESCMTYQGPSSLAIRWIYSGISRNVNVILDMIHGQNGWERIYPHVKDCEVG